MKVEIKGGYENAKQQLYNECLEDKKEALGKIKYFSFDNPVDLTTSTITLMISFTVVFFLACKLIFPSSTGNYGLGALNGNLLFGMVIICNLMNFYNYKSNKKYYANSIKKQEEMSFDDYIAYLEEEKVKGYRLLIDDDVMLILYDELNKINALQSPNVESIEYAYVSDSSSTISFFVKKRDGKKETFIFENIEELKFESEDENEEKLVYDDGDIMIYIKEMENKLW